MPDALDAFRYIRYLRRRWQFGAVACGVAVGLALAISLLLTPKYTATSRILIEPPAGTDLRSAMAVSPIYLESLRTYEHFASGETLFQKALDRFHLREKLGARAIESLRKQVLRTEIVRNTKILEINATLPDPHDAQALARFLAEETVALSRSVVNEGDRDLIAGIEQERARAKARMEQTEAEWAKLLSEQPVDGLQVALKNGAELRRSIDQLVLSAELELAEYSGQAKQSAASRPRDDEENARARLAALRNQRRELDRDLAAKQSLLDTRTAHRDALQVRRKADEANWTAVEARLREAQNESGYRGERLKIIDPGIVPERPSSPNLPLNLTVALLLGLVGSLGYLAIEMNYREARRALLTEIPRMAGHGGDD